MTNNSPIEPTIVRARDNPFSVDRVLRVRYRWQHGSWAELDERLSALDYRGAIVGPQGRGKTTLLEDLAQRLSRRGTNIRWLRFSRQRRTLDGRQWRKTVDALTERDVVCVDGAEQLGRWRWRWLKRRCLRGGGLLITAHRPGLLPTLLECSTTPRLVEEIVGRLIGSPGDALRATSRELFDKHEGNIRDVLREMYDLYARGEIASHGSSLAKAL